jgi:Tol biopolymer transport system component
MEVASNPTTETLSTDVYIKEGPKLNSRRLVQDGQAPALSWNGEKVAFFGFCRFDVVPCWQINVINADGSGRKKSKIVRYGVFAFTWSPVDDTLAYFDHPKLDGHAVVVVINEDGSGRRELTKSLDLRCGADSWPLIDWSPDGNRLAFTACNDGQPAVVTMSSDGKDAKVVVNGFGPRWSPNGKQLLFHHNSDGSPVVPSIWVANADGTEPRRVLDGEHAGYGLTWFPDGKSIAFASDRENKKQSEIFRINLDGTGLEKIATGTGV